MPAPTADFPSFCAEVQRRCKAAGPTDASPEHPFCLDGGNGVRIDAMAQLRCTLIGALAILLALASAITAIFTFGLTLQVLVGMAAVLTLVWLVLSSRQRRLGAAWQREATAWPAALVMAHHSVHEPGESIVPGAMLVDFGPSPDPDRLQRAAKAAFELAEKDSLPAAHTAVRDWLRLEMQRARFGRIRLPRDLAGNDTCWLVSLRFDRKMMPAGHVDRSLWFVKARPDRDESAEILPHPYWAKTG
jgi:hypothetical protein